MLRNRTISLKVVERVALALEEIKDEVIFVGGATLSLYVTDKGAEQPRPTTDIDVSVQVSTYGEMEHLRERLAAKRFHPAISEEVLYRYRFQDILIDFIPIEATELGPKNKWLKPGFQVAEHVSIGATSIKILPVGLFLASKWEAFKSRGGDPRSSHDFEDIVYTIDNNLEVVNSVAMAGDDVISFLSGMAQEILEHPHRNEIVECHINLYTAAVRRGIVLEKLEAISAMGR